MKLGIFGFGVVGQGLYHVLQQSNSIQAEIEKFCIKDITKPRSLDKALFTDDKNELLHNDKIDVIVELIDDAEAAFEIVKEAMNRGKHVVSANKKMIAEHLEELLELQRKNKVSLLYEGSCCASIPIIRNLEEYYDNDLMTSLEGIFNGSTNFILTKMINESASYENVLKEAQDLGFAESDPTLDVEGIDARYKLCILLYHAFGLITNPDELFTLGITKINTFDIEFAQKNNYEIKLIARGKKVGDFIDATVLPTFVHQSSILAQTKNEYNAVILESAFSESQFLYGKGAGDKPTGSAVLSDISALGYGYRYEYKKASRTNNFALHEDFEMKVYVRFKDQHPNESDFIEVVEKYSGPDGNYWIGYVSRQKMKDAKWLEIPDLNVIALG
ncbi:homoserine dehydrogenase [Reichenbachiella ulvae]|uniref:Homoserine dehydrogenase n=1 Tax=Reichenbachiella ulvae TaxID=2980104 RepID=A0ABT3CZH8_9BACT|nr:homoserine dehydrogenase [Reichenbachiella ulvae]MCV9389097.1 homoserine dehydrogenase [Reichenbachiella ulvae]